MIWIPFSGHTQQEGSLGSSQGETLTQMPRLRSPDANHVGSLDESVNGRLWHCGSKNGYEAFFPFVKVNVGPVPVRLSSAFPVGSDLGRSPPWTGLDCMWLLNDFF